MISFFFFITEVRTKFETQEVPNYVFQSEGGIELKISSVRHISFKKELKLN